MNGLLRKMEREGKSITLRNMEGECEVNVLLFADDAACVGGRIWRKDENTCERV